MADYDRYDTEGNGGGFMMGLLTGTVLGAGLGMLLAPKAGSELRGTLGEQARHVSEWGTETYRKASEAATHWSDRGREYVERAREAVAHGADEAREFTSSSGTNGGGLTSGSSGSGSYGQGTGSTFGTSGTPGSTEPRRP
jgi:gas vesicle protein